MLYTGNLGGVASGPNPRKCRRYVWRFHHFLGSMVCPGGHFRHLSIPTVICLDVRMSIVTVGVNRANSLVLQHFASLDI